ncbi:MAG: hypothetical protein ACUVX8_17840 [Candidatus Zipacnadales bacterium]
MRYHTTPITFALAVVGIWALGVPPARGIAAEDGLAPGEQPAPTVEALLPQLLRTDMSGPYPMAAIKFGPEFWAALETDLGRAQNEMFRNFFSGGLLFGIGPLENVLQTTQKESRNGAPIPWIAPPTLRAVLVLRFDDPEVQVTIEGQPVLFLKHGLAENDPDNLLNQLEFIYFPLTVGTDAKLAQLATSLSLTVTGLAPGAVHRFSWQLRPPRYDYPLGQGPVLVQRGAGPQLHPDQELWAGRAGSVDRPAIGYGTPTRSDGLGEKIAGPAPLLPPETALTLPTSIPPLGRRPEATLHFPFARAGSSVGGFNIGNQLQTEQQPLIEVYAGVETMARTDDSLTVAYWTSPLGREQVELVDRDGKTVERLKSGPASATGEALASWKLTPNAQEATEQFAVAVRNSLVTPHGAQVSETIVPLPSLTPVAEPTGAMPPSPPTVTDIAVTELSIAGAMLQVRARVAPVTGPEGPIMPEMQIAITNEAGELVKVIRPTPPAPGKDYIFAWSSTDETGQPVSPGRYLLRIGALMESDRGHARAELRYWVDVPLEITQRRLTFLGPSALQTLQAHLLTQPEAEQALFAYVAPREGQLHAFVVDDVTGRVVAHLADMRVAKGAGKISWNGTDDEGKPVAEGSYTLHFELDAGEQGRWWGAVAVEAPPPR